MPWSALFQASAKGYIEIVKFIVSNFDVDINAMNQVKIDVVFLPQTNFKVTKHTDWNISYGDSHIWSSTRSCTVFMFDWTTKFRFN